MVTSSDIKNKLTNSHDCLKQAFFAALRATEGCRVVQQALPHHLPVLQGRPVSVIAIGKAAESMYLGVQGILTDRLHSALIITTSDYRNQSILPGQVQVQVGNHPIPGPESIQAGECLMAFVREIPPENGVLLLISGGSSAMVEKLPESVDLPFLQRANEWLIGSGLDIQAINTVRKRLSLIKGGRLALALNEKPTLCLIISDVAGDRPEDIGSGLVCPETISPPLPNSLPDWLRVNLQEAPAHPTVTHIATEVIANNATARKAAAAFASRSGLEIIVHNDLLTGPLESCAQTIADVLLNSQPGLHVWGGEPVIHLPKKPGYGGRNQALALAVAEKIAGKNNIAFLSAGTDGFDGNTRSAGAMVDGNTLHLAKQNRLDIRETLERADSGSLLSKIGCTLTTGATGTNVMDIMLGIKP